MSEENSLAEALMAKHLSGEEPTDQVSQTAEGSSSSDSFKGPQNQFDIKSLDAFPSLTLKQTGTNGFSSSGDGTGLGVWGKNGGNSPSSSPGTTSESIESSNSNESTSFLNGSSSPTVQSSTNAIAARSGAITDVFTLRADQQASNTKAIISSVVFRVRTATNTSVESSTSKAKGHTTFVIKGLPDNVRRAKRDLMKELSVKVNKKIQIPASSRAAVIGPKGSTLRPIIDKTGTVIQVGKRPDEQNSEGSSSLATTSDQDEEEEEMVDVSIEGDEEGVQLAIQEINNVINSKIREITSKIQNIDTKLIPFIHRDMASFKGEHDNLKISVNNGIISIFGERAAVLEVKAKIEDSLREMVVNYDTSYLNLLKVKHKFVDTGRIMKETGISVTAPIDTNDSLELFGPKSNLESAKKLILSLTQDIKIMNLDISKAHDKNLSHARNITSFFKKSGKLQQLEKSHEVVITIPSFSELYADNVNSVVYEITGTDGEKIKEAKKSLVSLVNKYGPSHVLVTNDLDPFFYNLISKGNLIKTIRQEDHVEVVLPQDPKVCHEVVLVYEEADNGEDDFAPGASEISEALSKANSKFDDIREKQKNIISKVISIKPEKQKFFIGPGGTTLHAIIKGSSESDPLVSVIVGVPKNNVFVQDITKFDSSSVLVRGLKAEVDRIVAEINQAVEDGENYEALSNYSTEFSFPIEHLNKLIGKQGSNVGKLREEYGVKIEVDENGNGYVKGIKKNADEAKARILALGKRLSDETTVRLKIASELHPTLIGQGGKFVRRLKDKYDVIIRFPKIVTNSSSEGEADLDHLKKDEVLIRGSSRGVAKTKEELLDLVNYEIEHSYTECVKVPLNALSRIIGRQGEYINEIKDETNTRINVLDEDVPQSLSKEEKAKLQVSIEIIGTKTGVKSAITKILDIVKEFSDIVEESIEVDPKYHALVIGPGGQTRRDIIAKACGSPDAPEVTSPKTIHVPPAGSKTSVIKVYGNKKVVSKIIKAIKELVAQREKLITDSVDVPVESHRAVIGPGGLVKQGLESDFNVSINIPKRGSVDASGNLDKTIQITGESRETIDQVKDKISEIARDSYSEEIPVDRLLHSDLTVRLSKKLATEFDLRVEFPRNVRIPPTIVPEEAIGDTTSPGTEGSLNYKFHVVPDSETTTNESGKTIAWRLRGSPENVAKGRKVLESTIEELKSQDATGFLWLADPSKYGAIIGPQGTRVNKIRQASKCTVTVPRADGSAKEVIILRGSKAQLEVAKKMILDAVSKH